MLLLGIWIILHELFEFGHSLVFPPFGTAQSRVPYTALSSIFDQVVTALVLKPMRFNTSGRSSVPFFARCFGFLYHT